MLSTNTPTLAQWWRVLFSQVLFPASDPLPEPGKPLRWVILTVLALGVCLAGLNMPLLEPDETRYANIPREMLASGDLAIPVLDGEPYYDKPPLLYWGIACSYELFGVSIQSARLIPSLAVIATLLLTYAFGKKNLPEETAWRGTLILALAPGMVGMGRLLLLDGLLTLVVFLGQAALWQAAGKATFHRGWWVLAAILAGIGLMTKGPIALLLIVVPLMAYLCLSPEAPGERPTWRGWLAFGMLATGIALPWHLSLALRDPEFLRHYFWEHHVLRFLQPFDHIRGTFFYLPILAIGLFPGSLLVIKLGRQLASTNCRERSTRNQALGYWLLAGSFCVFFFSLSGCKLPTYVLPAFPALALILGHAARDIPAGWWRGCLTAWLIILTSGLHLFLPCYAWLRSPLADKQVLAFLDSELAKNNTGLVAYPRPCHAISWHLNRANIRHFRSKDFDSFRADILSRPRTVVLCTHRHSLAGLKQLLPPRVRVSREIRCEIPNLPIIPNEWQISAKTFLGETALGLCDVAVLEVGP